MELCTGMFQNVLEFSPGGTVYLNKAKNILHLIDTGWSIRLCDVKKKSVLIKI